MRSLSRLRPSYYQAFTIIESLVVLVVIAILAMILLALMKHHMKPSIPSDIGQPNSQETTISISTDR